MSIERERRVFELLDEALEHPTAARAGFLAGACDDPKVRERVEALLREDSDDGLPSPGTLAKPTFDVHAEDPAVGRKIGHYRLVRLLGRGGMGAVYLAEREDFDQQVALKLIRRGLDGDDLLIRRFHNERQILARLDHPYIARLLDGGTTEDHQPYFVMERVEGLPIDRYCREQIVGIEARLRLFLKVCQAVQVAHQRLVVHRDLKPGNVLITPSGDPKLLDFGIAKLLDDDLAAQPLATMPGQGPMTPRYASPEQIQLETVTTSSDVYSLGVLLYELLTGLSPYAVTDGADPSPAKAATPGTVAHAVCHDEAERPSTAVRKRGESAKDRALPEPATLQRRLAGDLDSIVLRALHKDQADRYASVEQLASDIEHHLEGRPVSARDGTTLYLLGKALRRHRLAVGVATLFMVLCVGFGAYSMLLRQRAESARDVAREAQLDAESEGEKASETVKFLKDLFGATDPNATNGEEISALDLLRHGERQLGGLRKAEVEIELAGTLGALFLKQGALVDSERLLERAYLKARSHWSDDHDEIAVRLANWGLAQEGLGKRDLAEEAYRKALAMRRRLGQSGIPLLAVRSNLAGLLTVQGRYDEAEPIFREILATRKAHHGDSHERVANSRRSLGVTLYAMGEHSQAERQLRIALEIRRQIDGPEDTSVASILEPLGNVLAAQQEFSEAEEMARLALTIRQQKLSENDKTLAVSRKSLATLLIPSNLDEASLLLDQSRRSLEERYPSSWQLADVKSAQGALLTHLERFEEAEILLLEAYKQLVVLRDRRAFPAQVTRERIEDLYRRWDKPERWAAFTAETSGTVDRAAPEDR